MIIRYLAKPRSGENTSEDKIISYNISKSEKENMSSNDLTTICTRRLRNKSGRESAMMNISSNEHI